MELLKKIEEKHGKVVVLIDEYVKPIIDYLDEPIKAEINRKLLRDFYVFLKDAQQYLRFVFITGISRFSKVSIFSALNHLQDISMKKQYAACCGYSQTDLETVFPDWMSKSADALGLAGETFLAETKRWYNG